MINRSTRPSATLLLRDAECASETTAPTPSGRDQLHRGTPLPDIASPMLNEGAGDGHAYNMRRTYTRRPAHHGSKPARTHADRNAFLLWEGTPIALTLTHSRRQHVCDGVSELLERTRFPGRRSPGGAERRIRRCVSAGSVNRYYNIVGTSLAGLYQPCTLAPNSENRSRAERGGHHASITLSGLSGNEGNVLGRTAGDFRTDPSPDQPAAMGNDDAARHRLQWECERVPSIARRLCPTRSPPRTRCRALYLASRPAWFLDEVRRGGVAAARPTSPGAGQERVAPTKSPPAGATRTRPGRARF